MCVCVCVCVCVSYRTANLQMLHFIYIYSTNIVLNILNMLHTLCFFLFKMPFISQCYLFLVPVLFTF